LRSRSTSTTKRKDDVKVMRNINTKKKKRKRGKSISLAVSRFKFKLRLRYYKIASINLYLTRQVDQPRRTVSCIILQINDLDLDLNATFSPLALGIFFQFEVKAEATYV
jgi:hypothetical protein